MGKYYYKCSKCNKIIKRFPNFNGDLLCKECRKKLKNYRICLNCKKEFYSGKSSRKFCSKSCSSKYTLTGRKLSKEHKEKLSKAAWNNRGNGYVKVKYYKIYCPYLNKFISVQGTYELKYAEYLNKNNIKWTRGKNINLRYKKDNDEFKRTYYPDFYLIEKHIYIETKGYFSDEAKKKMKLVTKQNKNKNIKILQKEDLEKLNIL